MARPQQTKKEDRPQLWRQRRLYHAGRHRHNSSVAQVQSIERPSSPNSKSESSLQVPAPPNPSSFSTHLHPKTPSQPHPNRDSIPTDSINPSRSTSPPLPRQSLPPPSLPLSPLPKWTFPTAPPSTSRSCFVASVQWSSGMIRASGSILSRYPVHGCFHCARSGVRIPVEPFFLSAPRRTLEV